MKIRTKVKLGALIVLIVAGTMATIFLSSSHRVREELGKVVNVNEVVKGQFEIMMLTQDYLRQHSQRAQEQWFSKYGSMASQLEVLLQTDDPQEKELIEEVKAHHQEILPLFKQLVENYERSVSTGNKDVATVATAEFGDRLAGQILVKTQSIVSDIFDMAATRTEHSIRWEKTGTTLVGASLAIMIAVFAAFMFMGWNITSALQNTAYAITTSSTEIAATVEQHERTALQQSAAATEVTTTAEELGASAVQSASQAESAAAAAKQALALTQEGVQLANRASANMSGMKQKIASVAEQILRLSEQAGQIGGIAKVVGELAGETNMLALNAAVEAARAGEQGKGFAVVAAEVRKLADQSKKSAERANVLVAEIQKATNSAVMVTEEGTRSAEEVTAIAQSVVEAFSSISGAANRVSENAQQVTLNSKQQSTALNQVTESMRSLAEGSRQMAAGTEQTKVGVQKLNQVALGLKAMV